MMAFNPFQQMPPSLKVEDATNTEALREYFRLLASSNFLTGGPPLQMPQVPVEGLRAMLPNGFPFPLVYPGLPQDFKPEFLTAGGGPMPFLMEGAFGFHPYAGLDGSRRKNATRETTAPLKEWLNSHRTNPYPTKQEKILLAVMTKMTLTQVSTWFANARRRLKKENGGNCSIKRREEGEDDDDDMAELDRPSSSASNISCGSNIKEEAEEEKEHSVDSKLEGTPTRENLTPKKKMLLIEDILGVKDKKQDDEVTSSKKDSPSSEESGPVAAAQRQFAAFQHMMAMYAQQNPQQAMLAAQMAQQSGRAAFFPFSNFPMMSMAATAAAMPTTPTGAGANGSFTSEATSASPSSCPSTSASKESSPQPKSPKNVKYEV